MEYRLIFKYLSYIYLTITIVYPTVIFIIKELGGESDMLMPQPSEYRKRAEECVQLAQTVRTPEQRTMLLHIAETWLRLASDASNASPSIETLAPATH